MKNFAAQLRSEIARIERDVTDRTNKLDLLKSALLHYEALHGNLPKTNGQTKAETVRKNVLTLLKEGPKHRQEILKELANKNILEPSDDGMNYLATRLSMWSETTTDGRGIWHLNQRHQSAE